MAAGNRSTCKRSLPGWGLTSKRNDTRYCTWQVKFRTINDADLSMKYWRSGVLAIHTSNAFDIDTPHTHTLSPSPSLPFDSTIHQHSRQFDFFGTWIGTVFSIQRGVLFLWNTNFGASPRSASLLFSPSFFRPSLKLFLRNQAWRSGSWHTRVFCLAVLAVQVGAIVHRKRERG